ncbi:MAG: TIGR01777 family oxidoreductase, partial [Bryobacteraceae bacterium]
FCTRLLDANMNYLITGATGFIGRRLAGYLLARGDSVNYLGRTRSQALDSRAAFHCWPRGEPPPLDSVLRTDTVVHLAGETVAQRWTPETKREIRRSRIERTRALVDGLRELKHKPQTLISASAVGYYGDRGDEVLTEASAPGHDFLADLCAAWEREAARAAEFGMRVVSVRIGVVLGREGGALPKMLRPFRLGLGGRLGSGRQWMSWIDADDLIRLIVFAAETPAVSGALNGSSPRPVRSAEFTEELARALRRPAKLAVPAFALKLLLGEMSEVVLASTRAAPEAAQRAGFGFEFSDLAGALRHVVG